MGHGGEGRVRACVRRGRAAWVLLLLAPAACVVEARPERPEPDLAPRLLHDTAEIAAYVEAFPADRYEIFPVRNVGRFYIDDNAASVKKAIRKGNPWEPHLIEEFAKHAVPGSTAIDVGAHIGSLTVPLARAVGREGRVYAFEPQRKIYRELVHNLRLNELEQVTALRFAVSAEPGVIEMSAPTDFDGHAKIGQGGDSAEARTLDSFGFTDVSLVKIDVEGHEVEVLRGAEQTLRRFHPVLLIEIWTDRVGAVEPILDELGYELRQIGKMDYIATHESSPPGDRSPSS